MSDPINMVKLVRDLSSRPRGRACLVLTHEYKGQKEWAAELARQTNSEHIDLLDHFAQDPELSKKIGQFMMPSLFEFFKDHCKSSVLIVSGLEFLKATWAGLPNAVTEFLEQIKTWEKKPSLLVVLQYDKTIATYDFGRRFLNLYVVDQKETLAL